MPKLMVSVAREANRKHFPLVKLNNFFVKMVKADCNESGRNRGMWRIRHETKEWDEDRMRERKETGRERERENKKHVFSA